jgi:hypothetical protein
MAKRRSSKAVRKSGRRSSKAVRKSRRRKTRKSGKKKRPLNAFFKAMMTAKKNNAPSFTYKGKTYKKKEGRHGMVFYKKA